LGTPEEPRVYGAKNARKLGEALARAKTLPLSRWILALAIPEVGETTARDLARFHTGISQLAQSPLLADVAALPGLRAAEKAAKKISGTEHQLALDKLTHARSRLMACGMAQPSKKEDDIITVVGPVVAASVLAYFQSPLGIAVLKQLHHLGLEHAAEGRPSGGPQPFLGKKFVITGTLSQPRPDFQKRILQLGGEVGSSVSSKTDYLLAGEEAGSKLDKARELGVPVLTEAEFEKLVAAS
jgi:DNA ligase (NAD+)